MKYRRYILGLVLYVAGLFILAYASCYFLFTREQATTAVALFLLSGVVAIKMVYYLSRTNRLLGNFLAYMHERDPSLSFTVPRADRHFRGLREAMEALIATFKDQRAGLEVQARYLEAILDNVSTGILCFKNSGEILTINQAALSALDVKRPHNIRDLESSLPGLPAKLLRLGPDQEIREGFERKGKQVSLLIHATHMRLREEAVRIVALNDISQQLEAQEILSWKKLIRVINHEIMNSMTPIITLATAIRKKLSGQSGAARGLAPTKTREEIGEKALAEGPTETSASDMEDAIRSADIIRERSAGLVAFIERYKKLTTLPEPRPETFPVQALFNGLKELMGKQLHDQGIELVLPENCEIELRADRHMMEQVMINLLKNAAEASEGCPDPEIRIDCRSRGTSTAGERVFITVSDKGTGIPPERLEQVFVPFYTTREEGSGIGLSLCRQIIQLHHGELKIRSEPGRGSSVEMSLYM